MKTEKSNAIVLDSSALMVFFEDESKSKKFLEILDETDKNGKTRLLSVINWGEILYLSALRYSGEKASKAEDAMDQMKIEKDCLEPNNWQFQQYEYILCKLLPVQTINLLLNIQ